MQEAMQEEIESIALAVREHWELDLSPISNLQLTLEENGIVITGFDTWTEKSMHLVSGHLEPVFTTSNAVWAGLFPTCCVEFSCNTQSIPAKIRLA